MANLYVLTPVPFTFFHPDRIRISFIRTARPDLFLVRIGNECPLSHHHLQCNRLVQSLSLDCYVADSLCTYSEMCKYLCLSPGACLQGLASKLSSLRVATASFPGTVRIKVPFTQKT